MSKRKMEINLTTTKTGGKHSIKQIGELLEQLGYKVRIKFTYGSIVSSGLTANIWFDKNV